MSEGKWGDLVPRVLSAIVMIAVGIVAVWKGGFWFQGLIVLVVGGMIWELVRMLAPDRSQFHFPLGLLGAMCLLAALAVSGGPALLVLLVPALAGVTLLSKDRLIFAAYASGLMLASYGLAALRSDQNGLIWVIWLAAVVIASDVAGYFAGRILGGPKFWPRVSPKKTWSGTAAGWICAAAVGLFVASRFGLSLEFVVISAVTAFAGQMGDVAESAIKRHTGIKDSSHLIPGHGGLLDRFDAMMGAALFVVMLSLVGAFPPGAG